MIPLEVQVSRIVLANALIKLQLEARDFKEVDKLQQVFDNFRLSNEAENIANGE